MVLKGREELDNILEKADVMDNTLICNEAELTAEERVRLTDLYGELIDIHNALSHRIRTRREEVEGLF